jgi:hypothetical protein
MTLFHQGKACVSQIIINRREENADFAIFLVILLADLTNKTQ